MEKKTEEYIKYIKENISTKSIAEIATDLNKTYNCTLGIIERFNISRDKLENDKVDEIIKYSKENIKSKSIECIANDLNIDKNYLRHILFTYGIISKRDISKDELEYIESYIMENFENQKTIEMAIKLGVSYIFIRIVMRKIKKSRKNKIETKTKLIKDKSDKIVEYSLKNPNKSTKKIANDLGIKEYEVPYAFHLKNIQKIRANTSICKSYHNEVFKSLSCIGYSNYKVSNYGRFINNKNELMHPRCSKKNPILMVTLTDDYGKRRGFICARLVGMLFIPIEDCSNYKDYFITYKNGDKADICADNLEWIPAWHRNVKDLNCSKKEADNRKRITNKRKDEIKNDIKNGLSNAEIQIKYKYYSHLSIAKIRKEIENS